MNLSVHPRVVHLTITEARVKELRDWADEALLHKIVSSKCLKSFAGKASSFASILIFSSPAMAHLEVVFGTAVCCGNQVGPRILERCSREHQGQSSKRGYSAEAWRSQARFVKALERSQFFEKDLNCLEWKKSQVPLILSIPKSRFVKTRQRLRTCENNSRKSLCPPCLGGSCHCPHCACTLHGTCPVDHRARNCPATSRRTRGRPVPVAAAHQHTRPRTTDGKRTNHPDAPGNNTNGNTNPTPRSRQKKNRQATFGPRSGKHNQTKT